ncbi:carbohydrate sulfotransferase 15 [Elysia marginata]|uniref:Carbohydrate sulfotransferase 15 n=1 Tax=Elysia marginata TaxID=1093978 RepID=A0AAV4IHP2_9GAST|nr:carbohydrate sulfotransferase 15 [Elysia marginata]
MKLQNFSKPASYLTGRLALALMAAWLIVVLRWTFTSDTSTEDTLLNHALLEENANVHKQNKPGAKEEVPEAKRKSEEKGKESETNKKSEDNGKEFEAKRKSEEKGKESEANRKSEEKGKESEVKRKSEEKGKESEAKRKSEEKGKESEANMKSEEKGKESEAKRKSKEKENTPETKKNSEAKKKASDSKKKPEDKEKTSMREKNFEANEKGSEIERKSEVNEKASEANKKPEATEKAPETKGKSETKEKATETKKKPEEKKKASKTEKNSQEKKKALKKKKKFEAKKKESKAKRKQQPLQFPTELEILQIAADDFNLTCSHLVPLQRSPEFTKKSKNPCYWDQNSKKLRCLPYFYVAGFPKSGTTDFYNIFRHHSEYEMSMKEYHWFNHLQFKQEYGSLEVYLSILEAAGDIINRDFMRHGFSRKITGDFTPDYLCDSMRWRCMEENQGLDSPNYTNAHSIHSLTPDAKFVVFMREPADRLFSRFQHMNYVSPGIFRKYWGDPTPETFHKAAMRAIQLYSACMKSFSARQCIYNETLFGQAMMNDIGFYSVCLEDYLKLFPRKNFLFLPFEEYSRNRTTTFQRVIRFLDMSPVSSKLQQRLKTKTIDNAGHFKKRPMLDKTRTALRQFFSPFVQELKKIVGEELIQSWGY